MLGPSEVLAAIRVSEPYLSLRLNRGRRLDEVDEVVVSLVEEMPAAQSAPHIKRLAEILSAAGYSVTRSRTRVSVMRPGDRAVLPRIPDTICRRRD